MAIYPVGLIIDKISLKIILPISYLVSGIIISTFYFIEDPDGWLSYVIWCLTTLAFCFQIVSLENYFSRNVPKEVRGIMFGIFYVVANLGRLIFYKVGGILFD